MCIPLCLRVPILYHACTACEDLQRGIWSTGHSQPSAPNAAHPKPFNQVVEKNFQVPSSAGTTDMCIPGCVFHCAFMCPSCIMLVLLVKISNAEFGAQAIVNQVHQMLPIKTKANQQVRSLHIFVHVSL